MRGVALKLQMMRRTTWRCLEAARDAALLLLAPQDCRRCGALVERFSDGVACRACWEDWRTTQAARAQVCDGCGRWAEADGPTVVRRARCEQCGAWSLAWVRSGGAYTGALRATLLALKRRPVAPTPLCELLQATWRTQTVLHTADLILPIPLAMQRRRSRGYNQAEILADVVARAARLPVVTEALVRRRETHPHRAGLDEYARRAALRGAFQVVRPRLIAGRRILLVDDVLTSGATLDAAATSLLAAGATMVMALTAARTLLRKRVVAW